MAMSALRQEEITEEIEIILLSSGVDFVESNRSSGPQRLSEAE
jgi:hypothetical protein